MFNDDESEQAYVEYTSTVADVRQYGRELCLLVVTGSPEPPLFNKHLFTPSFWNNFCRVIVGRGTGLHWINSIGPDSEKSLGQCIMSSTLLSRRLKGAVSCVFGSDYSRLVAVVQTS